ncbi:MAG TPA: 4a-hydroxytetrahydrobiopterin dehydratase [Gammaproteobacteria bacterium]|nr:4a-hydroxytetrahydrobiopterin dehydratase [Gammaproteobacteria bacterium]
MNGLATRQCSAPAKGTAPLAGKQLDELLAQINEDWQPSADKLSIDRDFGFSNFHQTMAFVNAVAWIAHQQDHHPDMEIGYKHCFIRYSTHEVGGLSENDFICAARIEELL